MNVPDVSALALHNCRVFAGVVLFSLCNTKTFVGSVEPERPRDWTAVPLCNDTGTVIMPTVVMAVLPAIPFAMLAAYVRVAPLFPVNVKSHLNNADCPDKRVG